MNNKELLNKLYNAKTDEEVTNILNQIDAAVWKPYGNDENNATTIHNQMDDPLRCLVENLVNGIDATKMLEARLAGVNLNDPHDFGMPKNSKAAIEQYFKLNKPLYQCSQAEKRELCNVGIYVEQLKANDSKIIIYDFGEGQKPEDFENTLLSLGRGNKSSLKFVQGKYNMGSTGILTKCNGHRYELIISMKNLRLKDSDKKIGFTIVRREDPSRKDKKFRIYEYLTINDEIPYVSYSEKMKNFFYGVPNFRGGCIRKLYSYNIGKVGGSARLPWRINSLFYDTELPIRITTPKSENDKNQRNGWIVGAINKIYENQSEVKVLLKKKTNLVLSCGIAKVTYLVFSNNTTSGNSVDDLFINGHNVSFIDGGQNNGDLPRTFLSNDCGFTQIAKNMMVFIDTSDLPTTEMADVYKPSRDRIDVEAELSKVMVRQLKDILMEDQDLIKLNEEFKGKSLYNADAAKLAEEAMKQLSENDNIKKLLLSKEGDILKKMAGIDKKSRENEKKTHKSKRKNNAVISLKPNEVKQSTISYGKTGSIEYELGSEFETKDLNSDIIISIKPLKVKERKNSKSNSGKKREFKNTYSKTIEDGKIKLLVNPTTMGYYTEESFEISFEHIADETFNAVVQVVISETDTSKRDSKKEDYEKIAGPELCFIAKTGSKDGVISWDDLPFKISEQDVCRIIITDTSIDRIYINLDSTQYHKQLDKGIDVERLKSKYISDVYVQSIINYLSQAGSFVKMFEENSIMNDYKDVIINNIVVGTEESVKNIMGLSA